MKNIGYILTHMLQYLQWDSFQVNLQFVPWYSFIEISLKKPISSLNLTYLDSMIFSAIIFQFFSLLPTRMVKHFQGLQKKCKLKHLWLNLLEVDNKVIRATSEFDVQSLQLLRQINLLAMDAPINGNQSNGLL